MAECIPERHVTIEQAMQKAGGWGKFQTFLLVAMIIAVDSCSLVIYGIGYLELLPTYMCVMKGATTAVECERETMCTDNNVDSWYIDTESMTSLNNWNQ